MWPTRGGEEGRVVFLASNTSSSSSKVIAPTGVRPVRDSIVASSWVAYGVVGMFVVCGTDTTDGSEGVGGMALFVGPSAGGASGSMFFDLDPLRPPEGSTPPTWCHVTSTPGLDDRCMSLGKVSASYSSSATKTLRTAHPPPSCMLFTQSNLGGSFGEVLALLVPPDRLGPFS